MTSVYSVEILAMRSMTTSWPGPSADIRLSSKQRFSALYFVGLLYCIYARNRLKAMLRSFFSISFLFSLSYILVLCTSPAREFCCTLLVLQYTAQKCSLWPLVVKMWNSNMLASALDFPCIWFQTTNQCLSRFEFQFQPEVTYLLLTKTFSNVAWLKKNKILKLVS